MMSWINKISYIYIIFFNLLSVISFSPYISAGDVTGNSEYYHSGVKRQHSSRVSKNKYLKKPKIRKDRTVKSIYGKKNKEKTDYEITGETAVEYIDNIFELDESDIIRMNSDYEEEYNNGRYKNMNSETDICVSQSLEMEMKTGSIFGGNLKITPEIKYNYYLRNNELSYPEGKIELRQSSGEKDSIIIESRYLINKFNKNYFSGATDANANGNISQIERIYSESNYYEAQAVISYEYMFTKTKKGKDGTETSINPMAGYNVRRYNDTFSNRNRNGLIAGISLDFNFNRKMDLKFLYKYEKILCPGENELIRVDETETGADSDINGDGIIKDDAPFITQIDRSQIRHTFEIESEFDLSKSWKGNIEYQLRKLGYTTGNSVDSDHYTIEETRHRVLAGVRWKLSKKWYVGIKFQKTIDTNYNQNSYLFLVQYKFL